MQGPEAQRQGDQHEQCHGPDAPDGRHHRRQQHANQPKALAPGHDTAALQRIADVPIYETDALVRRATSLQLTVDARTPSVGVPSGLWAQLGLQEGSSVRVTQGSASAQLPARLDATLNARTVRVPSGTAQTRTLGAMFGPITVDKV